MIPVRYVPLVVKQIVRHRTRSLLTLAGVAIAMFLFAGVQAMQSGTKRATQTVAGETELVVYRKDRYCPFTSRMPQAYEERIARVPGVASVVPMKIVVNNCRTGLDVVTFRGVPDERFERAYESAFTLAAGSIADWKRRGDGALVGEALAARRRLRPGDRFDAAGITVTVAGILRSNQPEHRNVAYVHLDFLQRAGRRGVGVVTQFNVRVADPALLESVARAIDAEFARDADPTHTRSARAFVASAAADVVEIVAFTRWLGWGCLVAVLALVGNAIVMAVQDRIREHAVLQTLGFGSGLIARLILLESTLLAVGGGLIGSVLALAALRWGHFSLSVEGTSIPIDSDLGVIGWGLLCSVLLGAFAGAWPAWQASRREIVECFRAI